MAKSLDFLLSVSGTDEFAKSIAGPLAIPDESAIFSGDVLFQGSVGRVDLPGGDWPTLAASIRNLIDAHPAETTVFPGHMGLTTLEREIASNPFLADLPAAAE